MVNNSVDYITNMSIILSLWPRYTYELWGMGEQYDMDNTTHKVHCFTVFTTNRFLFTFKIMFVIIIITYNIVTACIVLELP